MVIYIYVRGLKGKLKLFVHYFGFIIFNSYDRAFSCIRIKRGQFSVRDPAITIRIARDMAELPGLVPNLLPGSQWVQLHRPLPYDNSLVSISCMTSWLKVFKFFECQSRYIKHDPQFLKLGCHDAITKCPSFACFLGFGISFML